MVRPHLGAGSAPVALLIVLFFLACHGAPGMLHQSAHVEAAGSHHGASVSAPAGHAGVDESPGSDTHNAAQSGSGASANHYAAAFLTLLLGAALVLARARVVRRVRRAIVARSLAPPRPRWWRPPPPPTPVRLQVFRL